MKQPFWRRAFCLPPKKRNPTKRTTSTEAVENKLKETGTVDSGQSHPDGNGQTTTSKAAPAPAAAAVAEVAPTAETVPKTTPETAPETAPKTAPETAPATKVVATKEEREASSTNADNGELTVEKTVVKPAAVPDNSMSGSAYRKAWESLDEDQQAILSETKTDGGGVRSLFEQIQQDDKQNFDQSFMRKGLKKAGPILKKISKVLDLASPFVSMEPAAGAALGLVKGSMSIAIAICGASDTLTADIQSFLQHVPAIDRCDSVVKDDRLPDIHHTLVEMYSALLLFYLKVSAIYKESKFKVAATLLVLGSRTDDILASFSTYAETLDVLIKAETFASTLELKDDIVEVLIHDTLSVGREREEASLDQFGDRSDEACSWIDTNTVFSTWASTSPEGSLWKQKQTRNVLLMTGGMGSGKTMASAHVVDKLSNQSQKKETPVVVCAYYCRDEGTENEGRLPRIYRSLLWQLLRQKPDLKYRFYQWHKMEPSAVEPTKSKAKLHQFLYTTVLSSPERVFLVVDGLDELERRDRMELLGLFRQLIDAGAENLRVFLSSRPIAGEDEEDVDNIDEIEEIDEADPVGAFSKGSVATMEMQVSPDRDRAIATYLIQQTALPSRLHATVVEELARRAEGSAIYVRLALEYLGKMRVASAEGFTRALDRLPSAYSGLATLYANLFDKMCEDLPENQRLLQVALEVLAAAERPLRQDEVAYAVVLALDNDEDDDEEERTLQSLDQVKEEVAAVDLMSMMRPFVRKNAGDSTLQLIHQSLNELLAWGPPERWPSVGQKLGKTKKQKQDPASERVHELNFVLLQSCIRYLLLPECEEHSLLPKAKEAPEDDGAFLGMGGDMFDDDDNEEEAEEEEKGGLSFSPVDLGFGPFFTYAATNWPKHFRRTEGGKQQPAVQDLIRLCQPDSQRLDNWVYQWCRPDCTLTPEYRLISTELDALVVAAIFGSEASIAELLVYQNEGSSSNKSFRADSAWTALNQMIFYGKVASIHRLVLDPHAGPILCHPAFFYEVVIDWAGRKDRIVGVQHNEKDDAREWAAIFDLQIKNQRAALLSAGDDAYAPKLLCLAARNGCLVLVQRLFAAAETDSGLHDVLFTVADKETKSKKGILDTNPFWAAAWEGHADVLRFLCEQQSGTESLLRYIDQDGNTVFHQWARRGRINVLRVLLQYWPEGVHLRSKGEKDEGSEGSTPLETFLYSCDWAEEAVLPVVQILVEECHVDATGKGANPWSTPLRTAARQAKPNVCRLLVTKGGADIHTVLSIDETTHKARLVDQPVDASGQNKDVEHTMLVELSSLLPADEKVEV